MLCRTNNDTAPAFLRQGNPTSISCACSPAKSQNGDSDTVHRWKRASMVHNVNRGGVRRAIVTPADLEEERHRLRESKMLLLLMAEKAGLAVPRACCPHQGKIACLSCSSDWLVPQVRLASGSAPLIPVCPRVRLITRLRATPPAKTAPIETLDLAVDFHSVATYYHLS